MLCRLFIKKLGSGLLIDGHKVHRPEIDLPLVLKLTLYKQEQWTEIESFQQQVLVRQRLFPADLSARQVDCGDRSVHAQEWQLFVVRARALSGPIDHQVSLIGVSQQKHLRLALNFFGRELRQGLNGSILEVQQAQPVLGLLLGGRLEHRQASRRVTRPHSPLRERPGPQICLCLRVELFDLHSLWRIGRQHQVVSDHCQGPSLQLPQAWNVNHPSIQHTQSGGCRFGPTSHTRQRNPQPPHHHQLLLLLGVDRAEVQEPVSSGDRGARAASLHRPADLAGLSIQYGQYPPGQYTDHFVADQREAPVRLPTRIEARSSR